jgi:hypothetical protein
MVAQSGASILNGAKDSSRAEEKNLNKFMLMHQIAIL